MKLTNHEIIINEQFRIVMRPYGWALHTYNKEKPKIHKGKTVPEKTYHPTIKQLCEWVINRHAGQAEDFEVLVVALNRAAKNLESVFKIVVEKLDD